MDVVLIKLNVIAHNTRINLSWGWNLVGDGGEFELSFSQNQTSESFGYLCTEIQIQGSSDHKPFTWVQSINICLLSRHQHSMKGTTVTFSPDRSIPPPCTKRTRETDFSPKRCKVCLLSLILTKTCPIAGTKICQKKLLSSWPKFRFVETLCCKGTGKDLVQCVFGHQT